MHAARCAIEAFRGVKSVQFGFPYVDNLKIQERFGSGAHFIPRSDQVGLDELALVARDPVAGVVIEVPGNPLLTCLDVRVRAVADRALFVVDDTIAGPYNVDVCRGRMW